MSSFAGLRYDAIRLIAEPRGELAVSFHNLSGRMNFLFVAGVVGGDLRGLRPAEAAFGHSFLDLLAAGTGSVQVLLRIAFDLRCTSLPCLDFIAEIAKLIGQFRLIDSGRELLAVEETLRLDGARGTILALGHIEDDGMGVKLGSGVAIDRAGGVMLELCRYEFAGGFGGVVAADPRLGVPLQLGDSSGHCLPMGFSHPLIAANQCRQGNGLCGGERRVPTGPMLDWLDGG